VEKVDTAAVDDAGELVGAFAEQVAHGTHAKDHLEVPADLLD